MMVPDRMGSEPDPDPDRAALAGDLALAHGVAAGDGEAKARLAHRLVRRVLRLCRALVPGAADAEDAAQLAMEAVLAGASTYRGEAPIEHWADRIAARTAVRLARARGRVAVADLDPEAIVATAPRAAWEDLPRPIAEYLDRLSPGQRSALVLKHAAGYTTEEIARELGLPLGTIKERLVTARRELRRLVRRDVNLGTRRGGRDER
jgi:RNA polymerase sigma-70 factor, ECF subfamily